MTEEDRLEALRSYGVLDSEPDPALDRITSLAADLFQAPIALISLVDDSRQWFMSRRGLDACATPRDQSFCAHALALPAREVLVVEDPLGDPRFADNPLVLGPPHIRFYAGALLTDSAGANLGALCVIDDRTRPRPSDVDLARLKSLAAMVVDRLEAFRSERTVIAQQALLTARETELRNLNTSLEKRVLSRTRQLHEERARLEASETRLKDLVDHAGQAIVVMDIEGRVESWNRQAELTFGWTTDEALGRKVDELMIHPDRPRAHLADLRVFLRKGKGRVIGRRIEARTVRKDGREIVIELAVSPHETPDGLRFTALMHDITARKAQTELFENAFDHAPIGMALVDLSGQFLQVNPAFCDIIGYDAAEALTLDFQTITHAADLDADLANVEALLAGEAESYAMDKRYIRKDGSIVWVKISVSLARDERGKPLQFIAQVQELTARMEAEARYQLIAENTSDMIVTSDMRGKTLWVSAACLALTGWTPAEAVGRNTIEFAHEDDVAALRDVFARTARGENGLRVRWRGWHKARQAWLWLESSPSILEGGEGAPPRFLDVVRDIGAQVVQEAALAEATAAAEAATLAKSEFLANMSHELRTPLNAVVGYSRLLLESPTLSPADRRRAGIVQGAGEALNGLIDDLLDFSKLEAGGIALDERPFPVDDMVSEALSLVEPKARDNRVRLSTAGDEAGVVVGDRLRLRQVLLNFLSNAVKFTHDGAVAVHVSAADGPEGVTLKVSVVDEGVGVAPDKLDLLFKRFVQADSSINRNFGGTGLGLAISRELIEMMGGRVGVESVLGAGSTFWFEVVLPRGAAEVPVARPARGRATYPGRRVLVVDDIALNRELVQEMLHQHGCEADLAADGEQAVRAVGETAYDLVLMDVHMPVMDGLLATQAIRAAGHADLPILALTASGTPERVQTCLAAGMDGHLLKPLVPLDFERALDAVFNAAPPEPQPAAPAEDEAALQQAFEQSMGPDVSLRLIGDLRRDLGEMFLGADRTVLRQEAHRIAGSVGMVGFVGLGRAAAALEEACLGAGDIEPPLGAVRTAAADADRRLDAWIARLSARADATA